MNKNRLEAFSDGVIAVIITIMVLEIKAPRGDSFVALRPLTTVFLSYLLSFVTTKQVNGAILWANLHLLFWLSLVPFVTDWMGASHFVPASLSLYGIVLLMNAIAYTILQRAIILQQGHGSLLAKAVGNDHKGKLSLLFYAIAIPAAFLSSWIAGGLYVLVAVMWLLPDRRIERTQMEANNDDP
jgi:uncharacterized membrane protein